MASYSSRVLVLQSDRAKLDGANALHLIDTSGEVAEESNGSARPDGVGGHLDVVA